MLGKLLKSYSLLPDLTIWNDANKQRILPRRFRLLLEQNVITRSFFWNLLQFLLRLTSPARAQFKPLYCAIIITPIQLLACWEAEYLLAYYYVVFFPWWRWHHWLFGLLSSLVFKPTLANHIMLSIINDFFKILFYCLFSPLLIIVDLAQNKYKYQGHLSPKRKYLWSRLLAWVT